ncbi:MAG TPA: hypothetical protein ENJ79_10205 [Gammaproteobacteria bacterium]|nr:hypothetical protein [Gammaproteobacteria bacterium]
MNLFSAGIAGLFLLLLSWFAGGLVLSIMRNLSGGRRYRAHLAGRARELGLANMLEARGIGLQNWLHHESVLSIHQQLQRCADCTRREECRHLRPGCDTGFCPNDAAFGRLAASLRG